MKPLDKFALDQMTNMHIGKKWSEITERLSRENIRWKLYNFLYKFVYFTTNGEDTDIMALEGDDINHNLSNKIETIKNESESVYQ